MSTKLYDEALVNKIRGWLDDKSSINVLGPSDISRLYEIMADNNKKPDAPIELPIIAISRNRGFAINNTSTKPMSYDGLTLEATVGKSRVLNAIPITISYQLDVYARKAEEADIIVRNLIFNLINYTGLTVEVPGTSGLKHNSFISLDNGVDDNSDIKERFIAGNMTRLTLTISVNDAYLWDARTRGNVFVDIIVDTTMEDSFVGKGDNGDMREKYKENGVIHPSLTFEPYVGSIMIFEDKTNDKTYKLTVGEDVTYVKKAFDEYELSLAQPYKSLLSRGAVKDVDVIYTIKEASRYSSIPQDDTSLSDLVDRKIVNSYKIEQES